MHDGILDHMMAMLRSVFGGCVSDRSSEAARHNKIKFGVPLTTALKNGFLPIPLVEILVYIAKEGVTTVDLFRRPGNPNDTRRIVKRLSEGKSVILAKYNFYTLASVVKKFLLKIPGGVFTAEGEEMLLHVLSIGHKLEQIQAVHQFIESLWPAHQKLLALLFGTWFRIVNHCDLNYMTVEALSRSVAGSMFHTCAADPAKVEKASRIMQLLIENFGVSSMFGTENIEWFTETTRSGIYVREKFRYEYQYPPEELLPRDDALRWFVVVLLQEAEKFGFDPLTDAISEEAFYEMTQMHSRREHEHEPSDSPESKSPLQIRKRYQICEEQDLEGDHNRLTTSTISAPEVSLVPSPKVTKRPKSLEDNLNEVRTLFQTKSLSRFNSVKRKQLERLRQRSDWFLGPNYSEMIKQQQQQQPQHLEYKEQKQHEKLKAKTSGNSITKASSEGAVLDILSSDADSVFSDQSNSSRSESPISEPVRGYSSSSNAFFNSDIIVRHHIRDSPEITDDEMLETEICYYMVENEYGDEKS